ncbi:MAG: class I SAM-dependent methyltransferase [Bacteroidetes bacterium]|nr:class I SAM-dependent methyltransferase [Bacteroidota bacterium]
MKFGNYENESIGETTVKHNLSAFNIPRAAFGCGGRMELLIYPLVGYYRKNRESIKILVVGCRSEDDILWLKSYGFTNTFGLDLFSYSKYILIGDIHNTGFEAGSYDVVLLGWMISYTKDPAVVFKECKRILKEDGLLGIGLDHNPKQDAEGIKPPRVNTLNSTQSIKKVLDESIKHKVVVEYDHYYSDDDRCVVISKMLPG